MRHLKRLNPELVKLYRGRVESYERVVGDVARRSAEPSPPYVLGLRPPAGTPPVSSSTPPRRPADGGGPGGELVEEVLS